METIKVDIPKSQSLLLGALSVVMTALSAWVFLLGLDETFELAFLGRLTPYVCFIAGALGFIFFGISTIFWLMRTASSKPALEITDKGIIDNSTAIATKVMIPFENITQASVQTLQKNEYLAVDVKDEQAVLNSVSGLKRTTMQINKNQFGSSLVLINLKGQSTADLEKLAQIINERKKA